jgi:hypothetical protein
MKAWIGRIAVVLLGISGTTCVNWYMNLPEPEMGDATVKLIASMDDVSQWQLCRSDANRGEEVFLAKKDRSVKVTQGIFWATIHTRKKTDNPNPKEEKWYDAYEVSLGNNPWRKCNTLNGRETSAINKASQALRAKLERVELSQ